MLYAYQQYLMACEQAGRIPRCLNEVQTAGLIELLQNPPPFEEAVLIDLLTTKVRANAEAVKLKACYLEAIVAGDVHCPIIGKQRASEMLGQLLSDA